MKPVTINQFNGGLAEDLREQKTNTFSTCKGFDSTSFDHRLIPHGETEAEALSSGDITDKLFSDITVGSAGQLCAIGRNSAGSPTVFDLFDKDSATDIASTWASFTTLSGAGGYRKNSLTFYKGNFYVYDIAFNVRKYDGSWSTHGSVDVSSYWDAMIVPAPFRHPADNLLYFAGNQAISRTDGTTFADMSSWTIPNSLYISSITDFGADLAIATTPTNSSNTEVSRVFIHNRDSTNALFRENINWGEGSLMILSNLGGTLIGVSISDANYVATTTYTTTRNKKVTIKAYSGGEPVLIKEIDVAENFSLRNIKAKANGRLYFGGDNDDSLYVIYKDRQGKIIVSRDRFIANGTTVTTLRGFNVIGDYLFAMYDTAGGNGFCYRTKVTSSYTNNSTYESLINHGMEVNDRSKKKQLRAISVSKASTTGQLVVSYKVDGGAYITIGTLSASGNLVLKETRAVAGQFKEGYEYQFKVESTSGAEFTELKYVYEVTDKNIS